MKSCKYIKIIGTTVPDIKYVIQLHGLRERIDAGAAQAINIIKLPPDLEVAYVSFRQGTYGIECKNDLICDNKINNWVLSNFYFHHLKMRNNDSQGMYILNTDLDNFDRLEYCSDVTTYPKPSIGKGFRIEYCDINSTRRTGIQLSGQQSDTAVITYNTVRHSGTQLNDQQGANIILSSHTNAIVHTNVLRNSFTWSFADFGVYHMKVLTDFQLNPLD